MASPNEHQPFSNRQDSDFDELLSNDAWLRRLAFELCGNRADADDAVQELWATTLQRRREVKHPKSWLRVALRQTILSQQRSKRRRLARETEVAGQQEEATQLELVRARSELSDLVSDLAEPYRSTILLHFADGLTPKEIAERLDCPAATVRTRLKRGLDELRRRLRGDSDDDRVIITKLLPLLLSSVAIRRTIWKPILAVAGLIVGLVSFALILRSEDPGHMERSRVVETDARTPHSPLTSEDSTSAEAPTVETRETGSPATPESGSRELAATLRVELDGALPPIDLTATVELIDRRNVFSRGLTPAIDPQTRFPVVATARGQNGTAFRWSITSPGIYALRVEADGVRGSGSSILVTWSPNDRPITFVAPRHASLAFDRPLVDGSRVFVRLLEKKDVVELEATSEDNRIWSALGPIQPTAWVVRLPHGQFEISAGVSRERIDIKAPRFALERAVVRESGSGARIANAELRTVVTGLRAYGYVWRAHSDASGEVMLPAVDAPRPHRLLARAAGRGGIVLDAASVLQRRDPQGRAIIELPPVGRPGARLFDPKDDVRRLEVLCWRRGLMTDMALSRQDGKFTLQPIQHTADFRLFGFSEPWEIGAEPVRLLAHDGRARVWSILTSERRLLTGREEIRLPELRTVELRAQYDVGTEHGVPHMVELRRVFDGKTDDHMCARLPWSPSIDGRSVMVRLSEGNWKALLRNSDNGVSEVGFQTGDGAVDIPIAPKREVASLEFSILDPAGSLIPRVSLWVFPEGHQDGFVHNVVDGRAVIPDLDEGRRYSVKVIDVGLAAGLDNTEFLVVGQPDQKLTVRPVFERTVQILIDGLRAPAFAIIEQEPADEDLLPRAPRMAPWSPQIPNVPFTIQPMRCNIIAAGTHPKTIFIDPRPDDTSIVTINLAPGTVVGGVVTGTSGTLHVDLEALSLDGPGDLLEDIEHFFGLEQFGGTCRVSDEEFEFHSISPGRYRMTIRRGEEVLRRIEDLHVTGPEVWLEVEID